MATSFRCLFSILFLTLVIKGSCECSLNNLVIGTIRSGIEIQGKPQWNVLVNNNCNCTQSNIRFACKGFQTVERVDRSIFAMNGDSCLLINGNPLRAFDTIRFSYAWDPPFVLIPTSSVVVC